MIICDIFQYFAMFCPIRALEKAFQVPSGDSYRQLQQEVLSAPSDRRIDDIGDFIIGTDEDQLIKRITSVKGIYLFVEYDRISSTNNRTTDRQDDRVHVAITVATPEPDNIDLITHTLNQDKCLEIISSIRRRMRDDDNLKRGIASWMDYPATISVWASKALANSHGWSMEFEISAIDL